MIRISTEQLTAFGRSYFGSRGFSEDAARAIAEGGVNAQAFGITTHGLTQWGYVRKCLETGTIDAGAEPEILGDRGAIAYLTGPQVPGQVLMDRAVALAVAKAKACGIAMVAVKKSHWVGAVGPYLLPIAEQGYLAQAWAQSSACEDCAPVGGIDATFSTNPVALAIPTGTTPMIADFSTATVSMGKVGTMVKEGRQAGSSIFMDADGNLTSDPTVVAGGGSILFTGGPEYGHKGYALSLWCEALTALAGGDCNNPELPQSQSFNLTVIAPDAFGGEARYMAEMDRLVRRIKAVRRRPGVDAVRLPGERSLACLAEARENGVGVSDELHASLEEMAVEAGLTLPGARE